MTQRIPENDEDTPNRTTTSIRRSSENPTNSPHAPGRLADENAIRS
jgi:hypothetical protein